MSVLRLDGRIAMVTGAGLGLGRIWALALASRGAHVICAGRGSANGLPEAAVVDEIRASGGAADSELVDLTDAAQVTAMRDRVLSRYGRLDILANNAGMTRDKSFGKMDMADFQAVVDTNLVGTARITAAFWQAMKDLQYGRVIFTTSSAGLAGNFGQAAYAAAKMGLVGLMNTLGLEGARAGVFVNCLSPVGLTRMNAEVLPPDVGTKFDAAKLMPGMIFLASEAAPNREVLMAGAGSFETAQIWFSRGGLAATAEELAASFDRVTNIDGAARPQDASAQISGEMANVAARHGLQANQSEEY